MNADSTEVLRGDMCMNSVERVRRTFRFEKPDRIPMVFFNKDKEQGDIVMIDIQDHYGGDDGLVSEWGFRWERLDKTMGQPVDSLIHDWEADFGRLQKPKLNREKREAWVKAQIQKTQKNQYLLGSLQLSGFTVMSFLRGFVPMMEDFYLEPEYMEQLADLVFGFETELIEFAAEMGLHGIAFFDDWGTQSDLLISPELWHQFFRPRYEKQFQRAHQLGLDVYFHSCGKIDRIIGAFFDAGVDMLNISQPNLYDMDQLKKQYGGKGCFVIPVSYQTTSITGTREDIFADVKCAVESLGCYGGGLIGYIEEYSSMGMSRENYQSCIDAFREYGNYTE